MISIKTKGSFKRTKRFLCFNRDRKIINILDEYGRKGVEALFDATPKNTGLTAASWYYEIEKKENQWSIHWANSNIQNGIRIAVILDLGHATSTGAYIEGRNYIKPAIQPVFDAIAGDAWKEVLDA